MRLRPRWPGVLLLLIAGFLILRPAHADGGLFFMPGQSSASSADQQAVIIDNTADHTETMVLATRYVGVPANFAWIIPVPALPARSDIGTIPAGEQFFSSLFNFTEPGIFGVSSSHMGCIGCGSGATGTAGAEPAGVQVMDRLQVDGFDIATLDAQNNADLTAWLTTNGYQIPATSGPVLAGYINKGWKFVAVKVAVAPATDSTATGGFPPNPLYLTFPTTQLVFPLNISSISGQANGSDILLYVYSTRRVRASNYPTVPMAMPAGTFDDLRTFQQAYHAELLRRIASETGPGFVVECAIDRQVIPSELLPYTHATGQTQSGNFLTRLHTILRPEQMTADVQLTADGVAILDLRGWQRTQAQQNGLAHLALAALFALLCFAALRHTSLPTALRCAGWVLLALLLVINVR